MFAWLLPLVGFIMPTLQLLYGMGAGFSAQGLAFIPNAARGLWEVMHSKYAKRIFVGLSIIFLFLIVVVWFPLQVHFEKIALQEARVNDCEMHDACRNADPRLRVLKGLKADCTPYAVLCKTDPFYLALDHCLVRVWDNIFSLAGGWMEKLAFACIMTLVAMVVGKVMGSCCQERIVSPLSDKLKRKQQEHAAKALRLYYKEADH